MAQQETTRSECRERARRALRAFGAIVTLNDRTLDTAQEVESRLFSVTAQMGETNGCGDAKDAMADNVAAYEELAGKLKEQSGMFASKLDDLNKLVMRVIEIDDVAGQVLTMRYLGVGKPMEFAEIGERIGPYSEDYMRRKHCDGLDIVADLLDL